MPVGPNDCANCRQILGLKAVAKISSPIASDCDISIVDVIVIEILGGVGISKNCQVSQPSISNGEG